MRALVTLLLYLIPTAAIAQNRAPQIIDFFVNQLGQEAQRQQQLQQQQQANQHNYQLFMAYWNACFNSDDMGACTNALSYPHLSPVDRQRLTQRRATLINQQMEERAAQEERDRQERIRQMQEAQRQHEANERAAAEAARQRAIQDAVLRQQRDDAIIRAQQAEIELRKVKEAHWLTPIYGRIETAKLFALPYYHYVLEHINVVIAGGGGALFTALLFFGLGRRKAQPPERDNEPPLAPTSVAEENVALKETVKVAPTANTIPIPVPEAISKPVRDTEKAVEAMQLAQAYLDEVDLEGLPKTAQANLNTISLATKQILVAERADPDATLTLELEGGSIEKGINNLKAHALLYEGICLSIEIPKRAIGVFEKAIAIEPDNPQIHFWLGTTHADLFNKSRAVQALEKAVELDPTNINYRKALDRAKNISEAQIAIDRAFSMGRAIKRLAIVAVVLFVVGLCTSIIGTYGLGNVTNAIVLIIMIGIFARYILPAIQRL